MKIYLSIIILIIFNFQIFVVSAQTTKIDSLKNVLEKHSKEDTLTVNLLLDIAHQYIKNDINETFAYATKAKKLADTLSFLNGKAGSLRLIVKYYWSKGEYAIVVDYLKQFYIIVNQIGEKEGIFNMSE